MNDGDDVSQRRADYLTEPDKSPPLAIGQGYPLGEFPPQDLILNSEVLELGNQLIVVRSAESQEFGQMGGIHG